MYTKLPLVETSKLPLVDPFEVRDSVVQLESYSYFEIKRTIRWQAYLNSQPSAAGSVHQLTCLEPVSNNVPWMKTPPSPARSDDPSKIDPWHKITGKMCQLEYPLWIIAKYMIVGLYSYSYKFHETWTAGHNLFIISFLLSSGLSLKNFLKCENHHLEVNWMVSPEHCCDRCGICARQHMTVFTADPEELRCHDYFTLLWLKL